MVQLGGNLKLKVVIIVVFIIGVLLAYSIYAINSMDSDRASKAISKHKPILAEQLEQYGLNLGDPVFIRIFKQSAELEVFVQRQNDHTFQLFRTYRICDFSGALGPKIKEGDHQSPEGFYYVKANQLNPLSSYHLSFNLGFPNKYDRYHGRTGSFLMVHGNCVSIGCYAMTDDKIEEIYTLVHSALAGGQAFFRVHAFPFRMTDENMAKYTQNKWHDYWLNLKQGYDFFESHQVPPDVNVKSGIYVFSID
ncbi:probable exported protein STY0357 [hydrothermal vent metagenome]|uniref:Probable exported protein STY0357 n=1 Tax=hydrothermal vent metagenome TaxID=652676 RepID=A0A3B0VKR8_9ZZZZ